MHITFLFYEGMTALDAIGPHEVLTRLPGASVQCEPKESNPDAFRRMYLSPFKATGLPHLRLRKDGLCSKIETDLHENI